MPNFLQDVDLSRHAFDVALVFDSIFLENFDGYFFSCNRVSSNSDFSKSARAQRSP